MNSKQTQQTNNGVVSFDDFVPETHVSFAKVKLNKAGGKNVSIMNKHEKRILQVSGPLMTTWGVKKYVADDTGKVSYELQLQFPQKGSQYDTQEEQDFLEKLKQIEQLAKEHVRKNCRELLNKPKLSEEGMDLLWNPMLRYPTKIVDDTTNPPLREPDFDRAPSLRVKLPFYGTEWDSKFAIYNIDDLEVPLFPNPQDDSVTPETIIPSGDGEIRKAIATKIVPVLRAGGIYFASGKCGMTWRLYQAVVKQRPVQADSGCVVKIPAGLRERMEAAVEQEEQVEAAKNVTATIVADSDDEDEGSVQHEEPQEEEQAEPEPEPAKPAKPAEPAAAKKKVIRKKAT
jgi:hypothetical protein